LIDLVDDLLELTDDLARVEELLKLRGGALDLLSAVRQLEGPLSSAGPSVSR
jgi:hypothetical protein